MASLKKYIVIKDRVEIYKDFAINLLHYIHTYYIDRESLSADEDIRNHYVWCFNKVCDEFKQEELDFSKNEELKEYYYTYYYHQFYKPNENQDTSVEYYEKFWETIFAIGKMRNKNIINILVEVYSICDKSINNDKNILEIV